MGQACLGAARPAEVQAAKELHLDRGSFLAFGRTLADHPSITNKCPRQAHQNAQKPPLCTHRRSITCWAVPLLPPLRTFTKWDPAFHGGVASKSGQVSQVPLGETSQAGARRGLQLRQGVTRQRGGEGGGEEGACIVVFCQKHSRAPLRALLLGTAF